ncbi:MAG: adenylate/guanylate cyclase domain-containing protein [Zetaproteobacteria bacterium]|nr:MAG: adenylate/guanylate cyclase domain-containing protein [Zetaproteobacteria bacterium]
MRDASSTMPRIPIRWHWTVLVGAFLLLTVLMLLVIILDMERKAWLNNQAAQAKVQVDRLADELKIPLLAGSAERDLIVKSFLDKVPTVMAIRLRLPNGKHEDFFKDKGSGGDSLPELDNLDEEVRRLPLASLWYGRRITYAGKPIGSVAVRFSHEQWRELASTLVGRIAIAAVLVIAAAAVLVYWLAGRMSRPLEQLALAAQKVADGDYTVQLDVRGNNEISDAAQQFNAMVRELAHKEQMRGMLGRYLNPKIVHEMFESSQFRIESSRQEVTVLFADMVGFTAFSEALETEQVVDALNRHFEVFHRIIDYYGGHVDKYIGDAIMAVFNHPNEDPNHVEHAAKAALAINKACARLSMLRPDGAPISFRVGLNAGSVIVGNIGAAQRLQYTVIGDTVNIAARMTALGQGGQVVLPRPTFARLHPGFAFDSIGQRVIKGVSSPLECGMLRAVDADTIKNIEHAVALALDLSATSATDHAQDATHTG